MADEIRTNQPDENKDLLVNEPPNLEELSIFELDERLEFVAWCDNCSCTGEPPNS